MGDLAEDAIEAGRHLIPINHFDAVRQQFAAGLRAAAQDEIALPLAAQHLPLIAQHRHRFIKEARPGRAHAGASLRPRRRIRRYRAALW